MFVSKKSIIAVVTTATLLAACSGQESAYNASQGGIPGGAPGFSKSRVGTGLGAIGGAVIGYQFGGSPAGHATGAVIGSLLGAGIGHAIGSSLDRADMTYYNQAQYNALESGQPGQTLPWNNPQTGNSGS